MAASTTEDGTSVVSAQYIRALGCLRVVVWLVAIYGVLMVMSGRAFAIPLFDRLGFGPNSRSLPEIGIDYSVFCFGIIGAVIVGWMVLLITMLELAASVDNNARAMARQSIGISIATWFALDTGFSIAIGEMRHAAFNLIFIMLLAAPLYIMDRNDSIKAKTT